jgi:prepilin-type N-terminal cleavage/methylation domain-containing protein
MVRKILKDKKGLTLIELAISSSILAVIFGGITIFGAQTIRNFDRSQAIKNAVENSSYAIERLNKSIRTSNNIEVHSSGERIYIKDNKTSTHYCYFFQSNKLRVSNRTKAQCLGSTFATSASDLVGSSKTEISGSFKVKETVRTAGGGTDKRGFVRTNIVIKYNGDRVVDEDEIVIQSSVSLRDYGFYDPTP